MTLKKFDDATDEEIPLAGGLEVQIRFADGTSALRHFASWAHVPARILDGTVGGQTVAALQIRDLTIPATKPALAQRGVTA